MVMVEAIETTGVCFLIFLETDERRHPVDGSPELIKLDPNDLKCVFLSCAPMCLVAATHTTVVMAYE